MSPYTKTLLVLPANPAEMERAQLDEELRVIGEALASVHGDAIRPVAGWAATLEEVAELLREHRPAVVHWSGYGSPTAELTLEGGAALGELVAWLASRVDCVVFNGCDAGPLSNALAAEVSWVVGVPKEIGDPRLLRCSAAFYRGLAQSDSYEAAFGRAADEVGAAELPDAAQPRFRAHADAEAPRTKALEAVPETRTSFSTRGREPQETAGPRLQTVWFGTNRRPVDAANPAAGFSSQRDDKVHHGTCQVAVPRSHRFGSIGSPWWRRWLTATDDRLTVQSRALLAEEAFWQAARAELATWDAADAMALVFIHGFNVGFDEAAIRAAQLGVDLKIPGVTAFFSWPSQARLSLRSYEADGSAIEASEETITDFLAGFAALSPARGVHVLAHSMGNRGFLRALQAILARSARLAGKPFRQIVFAAPDVDQDSFRRLAAAHRTLAERATLYVSAHDRAVASSGLLSMAPRAGFTPPVTVIDGLDTVDVTDVDLTLLGHGYYGAAQGVLYDMHECIHHGTPAGDRQRLTEVPPAGGTGRYWKIGA
jgi:esterase/lipase superfamily enzyme